MDHVLAETNKRYKIYNFCSAHIIVTVNSLQYDCETIAKVTKLKTFGMEWVLSLKGRGMSP